MKRLPFLHRPRLARRILEVGGGHAPYAGVTHAVDKYPEDNTQRADSLVVPEGVEFRQGDLEAIPFDADPKFDFIYASHVLEHVHDPFKAVSEMNRVAAQGYVETPSPLREQMASELPFEAGTDFHTYFCWKSEEPDTIHAIQKTADTVGQFCRCDDGSLAKYLFHLRRRHDIDAEPALPRDAKTTRLYFTAPLKLKIHRTFMEACQAGCCAYVSAREVRRWLSFPRRLVSRRFGGLKDTLRKHQGEPYELLPVTDADFDQKVLRSALPVVVLVTASWSGAAHAVGPVANQVARKHFDRYAFFHLDVDANPAVPTRYRVPSIPAFLFFRNGELVRTLEGSHGPEALESFLNAT